MSLEEYFDPSFVTGLALREKQIQQNYRPIIGIHKWFARRPGSVFRSLLLAEFVGAEPLETSYWHAHCLHGIIADPFMGGGTPLYEANRLGLSIIGTDINPMSFWIVRQSLDAIDLDALSENANRVIADVEREVGELYKTRCEKCGDLATVKYFLWVKRESCPNCGTENDLFPGYLLAEATRHPKHVLACSTCGALNEYDRQPTRANPDVCNECGNPVYLEGPALRQRVLCKCCGTLYPYPAKHPTHPPTHRLWALEYHCESCKPKHKGRFFKKPDSDDFVRFDRASSLLRERDGLPIPDDAIPSGDETDRLHRWGYRTYREMFNSRQLLGLGLLLDRIQRVTDTSSRHALLTVFSDFLRYQNMLCRYDTYALKCQDIFSVHGFPVGLVQCENNLLGIPRVGSGSFRHFIEKYRRAKEYCKAPFETQQIGARKRIVPIVGENVQAQFVSTIPTDDTRQALILAVPAIRVSLPPQSLDGVFTDPPYFDNVQYAELMDFCFVWLRLALRGEFSEFDRTTTRTPEELTGNITLGRGPEHFTSGLSAVFQHYAVALKPGAPFVFTYHHNDPSAYLPLVVAILDAGMNCTATLPVAAEMSASLHIAGTISSVLDSVFVCRVGAPNGMKTSLEECLSWDAGMMRTTGMRVTAGDLRCLAAGHIARMAINLLTSSWIAGNSLQQKMTDAATCLSRVADSVYIESIVSRLIVDSASEERLMGEESATL